MLNPKTTLGVIHFSKTLVVLSRRSSFAFKYIKGKDEEPASQPALANPYTPIIEGNLNIFISRGQESCVLV